MLTVCNSAYTDKLLATFRGVHANPVDKTVAFPGHSMHIRSISNAMRAIHTDFAYVTDVLNRWDGSDWALVVDTVPIKMSRATVMLQGQLDAMAMCECMCPNADTSFIGSEFADSEMAATQRRLINLTSCATPGQSVRADFCAIANFWKRYIPYRPVFLTFECGTVDFQAVIGKDEHCNKIKSGPLMKDLLVPTYAGARTLLERLMHLYGVDASLLPPAL